LTGNAAALRDRVGDGFRTLSHFSGETLSSFRMRKPTAAVAEDLGQDTRQKIHISTVWQTMTDG